VTHDHPRNDTDFLRCLAIVCIVNSHLDAYYPVPGLATGGMLGNSLFFMLSAFGLGLSWGRHPRPFSEWYGRRLRRILPSIWAFFALCVLPLAFVRDQLVLDPQLDFLSFLLFPPDLWFIRALLVYYLVVFVVISRGSDMDFYWCLLVLLTGAAYGIAYAGYLDLGVFSIEQPPFKILFYLLVVLLGVKLASRNDRIHYTGWLDLLFLTVCLTFVYCHKVLMTHGIALRLQCIQQLLMFPTLYYLVKLARCAFITERLMEYPVAGGAIQCISGLTLEIYCAHSVLKDVVMVLPLRFPVNLAVLLAGTILMAALIKYLGGLIAACVLTENPRGTPPVSLPDRQKSIRPSPDPTERETMLRV
jgi:peptidoglycan/LPS O-acetylase OafA/YrhL